MKKKSQLQETYIGMSTLDLVLATQIFLAKIPGDHETKKQNKTVDSDK